MSAALADVVVVGGGPAGAATAWALARNGGDVLILDRARFPRSKPCAEFLSPQARRILAEMGALDAVIAAGATHLTGMTIHAVSGQSFEGRFDSRRACGGERNAALGVRREMFDMILLDRARSAGARVAEGVAVMDVTRDGNRRVNGVRVRDGGATRDISARVVIGADGLHSVIGRRLGLVRPARWPRRVGFVARFRGVAGVTDCGEMHVSRDGYCGIADVGDGVTNAGFVTTVANAKHVHGDAAGFFERWIRSHPNLGPRFVGAGRISPVLATGPFAVKAKKAWAPGAALVGDAADFFDPFTGEGMFEALRGGEMLGPYLFEALRAKTPRGADEALAAYDRARVHEFAVKWRVQKIVGLAVGCPPLLNEMVRAATGRRVISDLLVNVASGFTPAAEMLRLSVLREFFLPPQTTP